MDTFANPPSSNKFKNYLIDKLLNEQQQQQQQHSSIGDGGGGESIAAVISSSSARNSTSSIKSVNNSNPIDTNSHSLAESREDLHSETGTYTIEDLDEDNNNNNNLKDLNSTILDHQTYLQQQQDILDLRKSTASTNIDLVSARAAIDETFGIIKRPHIKNTESTQHNNSNNNKNESPKNSKSRTRNQTYSLTKDLMITHHQNTTNTEPPATIKIKPVNKNSSVSTSSSSSVSSSVTASSSMDASTNLGMKKTTTYEVIPNEIEHSALSTSRTIGTELLLGDTDQLMEQLKKKRTNKKNELHSKYLESKRNTTESLLSHSSSASSTGGSEFNLNKVNSSSSPITTQAVNDLAFSTRLSQSWTIPNDENDNTSETSAAVTSQIDNITTRAIANGGITFDYPIDSDKSARDVTNRNYLNSNNLRAFNSKVRPVLSSSVTTNTMTDNTTRINDMTLTKKYEHDRLLNNTNRRRSSATSMDECCSPLNSAKSTHVSLGTRIQTKAATEAATTSPTPPSPYTNRTLYLRQQTAKAKREQLDNPKSPSSTSSSFTTTTATARKSIYETPKPGILKKNTSSPMTSSSTNLRSANKPSVSRTTSRNSSPFTNNHHKNQNLMTNSLNLPSGSTLPQSPNKQQQTAINLKESFLRRKTYDPAKAVQEEKLKRVQQAQLNLLGKNGSSSSSSSSTSPKKEKAANGELNRSIVEHAFDDDLLNASFSSLPAQSTNENVANKQSHEKILQSTLQRLCIRLIQMSTGVMDKIGDSSSNSTTLFNNFKPSTELERMQHLATLVNSMQLVNDHIKVIDDTLFSSNTQESYIREITRIRHEVDTLKQTAVLNSTMNSSFSHKKNSN
jgi:hypothetical protein